MLYYPLYKQKQLHQGSAEMRLFLRRRIKLMTDKGSLIVVSGPSGSGKGTILNEFNQKYKDEYMTYSISATTRSPREGEMDGINYYFITTDEFKNKISNDGFLEYAKYCEKIIINNGKLRHTTERLQNSSECH